MAPLPDLDMPCRLHRISTRTASRRGVVPEIARRIAPDEVLQSWFGIEWQERSAILEGFILIAPFPAALQRAHPRRTSPCACGAGAPC